MRSARSAGLLPAACSLGSPLTREAGVEGRASWARDAPPPPAAPLEKRSAGRAAGGGAASGQSAVTSAAARRRRRRRYTSMTVGGSAMRAVPATDDTAGEERASGAGTASGTASG